jgi:hypothetical protein
MAWREERGLLDFNRSLEEELALTRKRLNLANAEAQRLAQLRGLPPGSTAGAFPVSQNQKANFDAATAIHNADRAARGWNTTGQAVTTPLGPQNLNYDANEFANIQPPPMVAPPRQAPSRMSGPTPGDHHPPVMNTGGFKWPGMKIGSDALLEMSEMIAAAEPPPVQPAPNFKTRMGQRAFRPWNAGPPSSALAPTGVRQLRTPISSPAIDSTASTRNKKLEELLYGVS